jgi:hypothetical protein
MGCVKNARKSCSEVFRFGYVKYRTILRKVTVSSFKGIYLGMASITIRTEILLIRLQGQNGTSKLRVLAASLC